MNLPELGVEWEALAGRFGGELILPGSTGYDAARKPAMARFHDVRPSAIARCGAAADVAATIAFARSHGLQLSIRCGGHSVAGRSSGEGIIIDVAPMQSISVGDGTATVGAGFRLSALYDGLYTHGVTVPAGCGPDVGISGLTLGGGIGVLGRKHGLTCDRLRGAQIVLADGSVVECDDERDPDLFWALRGAGGGNFGVVTSLVFETVTAPDTTAFHLRWPIEEALELIDCWQAWAPAAPDEIDATLRLAIGPGTEQARAELFGAVLTTEAEAREHVTGFVSDSGHQPVDVRFRQLPYPDAKRFLNEVDQHDEPPSDGDSALHTHAYAKSEFFRQRVDRAVLDALVRNFTRAVVDTCSREVAFMPWGGAYNRVTTDATAFPHREELFLVQHLLDMPPDASADERESGHAWLTRSWELLHSSGSGGVYPNFPDPDLESPGRAYYDGNYERLRRVKTAYDPEGLFRTQELP